MDAARVSIVTDEMNRRVLAPYNSVCFVTEIPCKSKDVSIECRRSLDVLDMKDRCTLDKLCRVGRWKCRHIGLQVLQNRLRITPICNKDPIELRANFYRSISKPRLGSGTCAGPDRGCGGSTVGVVRSFVAVPNMLLPDRRRSLRDLLAEHKAQAIDAVREDLYWRLLTGSTDKLFATIRTTRDCCHYNRLLLP